MRETIANTAELEEQLSRPSPPLVELMARLEGDLMVLGAAGKVGPSLVRMALRAVEASGRRRHVIAVARRPLPELAALGADTLECDLLDLAQVEGLPHVENIVFMAGRKFGSTGDEPQTWATNVMAPYHVARTFTASRIAAFSTGCVYPLLPWDGAGATEQTPPAPVGEYAQSCLGRERMFDFFSQSVGERVVHIRLNYAIDLRYGVLYDIASQVWAGRPVNLQTGRVNVIWQGDACDQVLRSLELAASPAVALNITGPEMLSVRELALQFGELMGKPVTFENEENGLAYLSDASAALARFGPPRVDVQTMVRWTAHWLMHGGESLGKPTHFETQDGRY